AVQNPACAEGFPPLVFMFLLIASVLCQVEPVGRWFEAFIKRRNINVSASFQELEDEKELSEESGDEELQLEEFPMLKTLDPKDWKNQDHYAVLGLGNIRYRATQKQIKAARKYLSCISIPFFQMYTAVFHVKIHTCHGQDFCHFTGLKMPAL
uniref:Uncharacterized protein n=1 Tax=Buteo japonicus TaxID=224669 RepID=A0A8C0HPC0_9AVES